MDVASPYISSIFGLVGVIVGATITQSAAWWQKRNRHRAFWSAINAEIDICRDYAAAYLADNVLSPLYRLPVIAYENAFPGLLGDGAVSHEETKGMIKFYGAVSDINRGLDQVNDSITDGNITAGQHRRKQAAQAEVPRVG